MNNSIYNRSFCHTFSLPKGKWDARIRFRAYKTTKKCAGLQVYDIPESSIVHSVLYDDDIIIEIGSESIIGLCCQRARAKMEEAIKKRSFFTIYRGPCVGKQSHDVNESQNGNIDAKVSDLHDFCSNRIPDPTLGSPSKETEMTNRNISKNEPLKISLMSEALESTSKTNVTNNNHDMLQHTSQQKIVAIANKKNPDNLPVIGEKNYNPENSNYQNTSLHSENEKSDTNLYSNSSKSNITNENKKGYDMMYKLSLKSTIKEQIFDSEVLKLDQLKTSSNNIAKQKTSPPKDITGIQIQKNYEANIEALIGFKKLSSTHIPNAAPIFIDLTNDDTDEHAITEKPAQVNKLISTSKKNADHIAQINEIINMKQKLKESEDKFLSADKHMTPLSNDKDSTKFEIDKSLSIIYTRNESCDTHTSPHVINSRSQLTSTSKATPKSSEINLNGGEPKNVLTKIPLLDNHNNKQTDNSSEINQFSKNHLSIQSEKSVLSVEQEKPKYTMKIDSLTDQCTKFKVPTPENLEMSRRDSLKETGNKSDEHLQDQMETRRSPTKIENANLSKNTKENISSPRMLCENKKSVDTQKTITSSCNLSGADTKETVVKQNKETKHVCDNIHRAVHRTTVHEIKPHKTVKKKSVLLNSSINMEEIESDIPIHNLITLSSRQLTSQNQNATIVKVTSKRFRKNNDTANAESNDYDPFEEIKDDSLVVNIDRGLVTDFIFLLVAQLQYFFCTNGKTSDKKMIGLRCRHCINCKQSFRLFPSKQRHLKSCIQNTLPTHVLKCEAIPSKMKLKLAELKNKQLQEYSKIPASSVDTFYDKVWDQLQAMQSNYGNEVINDEEQMSSNNRLIDSNGNIFHSRKGFGSSWRINSKKKMRLSDIPLIEEETSHFCDDQRIDQISKNQGMAHDKTNSKANFPALQSIDVHGQHNAGNFISQVEYVSNTKNLGSLSEGPNNLNMKMNGGILLKSNVRRKQNLRTRSSRKKKKA